MANKTFLSILSIGLIAGSVAWGYRQYKVFNPEVSGPGERQTRAISPERRTAFFSDLNLSETQIKALDGFEGRERFQKLREIMTPEQKAKMDARRAEREAKRDAQVRSAISPGDYARYKQKSEERRRSRPQNSNRPT